MLFKEIIQHNKQATHEEIPDEELWEDGELASNEVQFKIIKHVMQIGDWILVRKVDNGKD